MIDRRSFLSMFAALPAAVAGGFALRSRAVAPDIPWTQPGKFPDREWMLVEGYGESYLSLQGGEDVYIEAVHFGPTSGFNTAFRIVSVPNE